MKFALMSLSCALILLGSGCTSSEEKPAPSPVTSDTSSAGIGGIERLSDATDTPASSRSAAERGPAYLLRYTDYKSGIRMELVNESHTSHVDQYSKLRAQSDASRKVTSDEWMQGLVAYLDDEGWSKEEQQGNAPSMAKGSLSWSIQSVGPDGSSFIAAAPTMKGAQIKRLVTMKNAFIQTYNATPGFQAVSAKPGTLPFKVPEYGSPLKKKGGK
ncbi:MAG TPA: hypothetical protein VM509_08215 [Planctomycetota bacterium]|nr:hypothetical protein [Planctomycetota bacterium]